MRTLAKHFLTLEELLVAGCCCLSEYLAQVLSSCPNLHAHVAIDDGSYPEDTFSHIKADVFIDRDLNTGSLKPRPCERSLKVFKVMNSNIPRPDLMWYGLVAETYPDQGREIQNLVYDRLARLTNLELLWLGHDPEIKDEESRYEDRG